MAFTKIQRQLHQGRFAEALSMPSWLKLSLTLLAIPAIGAVLYFVFVMCVLLFGDWRWGPS